MYNFLYKSIQKKIYDFIYYKDFKNHFIFILIYYIIFKIIIFKRINLFILSQTLLTSLLKNIYIYILD